MIFLNSSTLLLDLSPCWICCPNVGLCSNDSVVASVDATSEPGKVCSELERSELDKIGIFECMVMM